jgi:hypothetical protein
MSQLAHRCPERGLGAAVADCQEAYARWEALMAHTADRTTWRRAPEEHAPTASLQATTVTVQCRLVSADRPHLKAGLTSQSATPVEETVATGEPCIERHC